MKETIFELINLLLNMSGNELNQDIFSANLNKYEEEIMQSKKVINNLKDENKDDTVSKIKKSYITHCSSLENINIKLVHLSTRKNKLYEELKYVELNVNNNIENKSKQDMWNSKLKELNIKIKDLEMEESLYKTTKKDSENEIAKFKNVYSHIINDVNIYADVDKENKLTNAKNNLSKYEKEKLRLLTSPFFIASEIKKQIEDKNYNDTFNKINELCAVIDAMPYMNITGKEELEDILKNLQKEYNIIHKKIRENDYKTIENKELEKRLEDLKKFQKDNDKSIEKTIEAIDKINSKKIPILSAYVKELSLSEKILLEYDEDIEYFKQYSNLLNTSVLQHLTRYQEKLKLKMLSVESEIKKGDNLISEKEKIKDIDAIKVISENIELIKRRMSTNKTVKEIKEELDLLLTSLEFDDSPVDHFIKVVKIETPVIEEKEKNQKEYLTIDDILNMLGE